MNPTPGESTTHRRRLGLRRRRGRSQCGPDALDPYPAGRQDENPVIAIGNIPWRIKGLNRRTGAAGDVFQKGFPLGGFSFTKLKASGSALAIQNGTWSDAGSEAAGTKWSCVMDNVTGLIWEVKTNDGGLRDKDWLYSWYNTNSSTNGGSAGYSSMSSVCYSSGRCDTEKYVADVNTSALCGFRDWRMPRKEELQTIITRDRVNPAIDTNYFPNTVIDYYWTASTEATNKLYAWRVGYFDGTEEYNDAKSSSHHVRLVR